MHMSIVGFNCGIMIGRLSVFFAVRASCNGLLKVPSMPTEYHWTSCLSSDFSCVLIGVKFSKFSFRVAWPVFRAVVEGKLQPKYKFLAGKDLKLERNACARMHAHTCTCLHMCTHLCMHMHEFVRTHTLTHTHTLSHTCTHTCTHAHTHAHTHACTHTYTHTHVHTHTHTHTEQIMRWPQARGGGLLSFLPWQTNFVISLFLFCPKKILWVCT